MGFIKIDDGIPSGNLLHNGILMVIFMGFYGDSMGFYRDSMGYEWDIPSGNLLHSY